MEDLPEAVDQRLGEIETALAAIEDRPAVYDPADIARAGAFVCIDGSGHLRVERGYVRPEDEPPIDELAVSDPAPDDDVDLGDEAGERDGDEDAGEPAEEDEGLRPLPDRLLTELTAYRTLALREAVGGDPAIAYLTVLHVLCLKLFYRYGSDSCLEIEPKSVVFGAQAPGLADTPLAARVDERHRSWLQQLPSEPAELWDALAGFDSDSREALFAHCVSLTINAVHEAWNRRPAAHQMTDEILCASIATVTLSDAAEILGEVALRRLAGALPHLASLIRRFKGFETRRPIIEQTEALRALVAIGGPDAAAVLRSAIERGEFNRANLGAALRAAAGLGIRLQPSVVEAALGHDEAEIRLAPVRSSAPGRTFWRCSSSGSPTRMNG